MIHLEKIDARNVWEICTLQVAEYQEAYVFLQRRQHHRGLHHPPARAVLLSPLAFTAPC